MEVRLGGNSLRCAAAAALLAALGPLAAAADELGQTDWREASRDPAADAAEACGLASIKYMGDNPDLAPPSLHGPRELFSRHLIGWCRAHGQLGFQTLEVSFETSGVFVSEVGAVMRGPRGEKRFTYGYDATLGVNSAFVSSIDPPAFVGHAALRLVEDAVGRKASLRTLMDIICSEAWQRSFTTLPIPGDRANSLRARSISLFPLSGTVAPPLMEGEPLNGELGVVRRSAGVTGVWRSPSPRTGAFEGTTVMAKRWISPEPCASIGVEVAQDSPYSAEVNQAVAAAYPQMRMAREGLLVSQEVFRRPVCETIRVGQSPEGMTVTGMYSTGLRRKSTSIGLVFSFQTEAQAGYHSTTSASLLSWSRFYPSPVRSCTTAIFN